MRHYWITLGHNQRQCANCDAEQHKTDGIWEYDDMNIAMGSHRCSKIKKGT